MARLSVIVGWGSRVLLSDQLVDTKQKTIFKGGTYDQKGMTPKEYIIVHC